jgi:hypothetical protein
MRAEPNRIEERDTPSADLLTDDAVEPDIQHAAKMTVRR